MTIEQVIRAITIKFPKPIPLEKAEDLIWSIAEGLPADVVYKVHYNIAVYHSNGSDLSLSEGSAGVEGNIRLLGNSMAFDSFHMVPLEGDDPELDVMNFQIVPGWELEDYRRDVRGLWTRTRGVVRAYFREHP